MQIVNRKVLDQAFLLLPPGTKQRLGLLIGFQILTSVLDLMALYLLGTLASVGIFYIQNQAAIFPSSLTNILNLDDATFNTQFVSISTLIIVIFITKTFLAILGNRKILIFLGNRAASASSSMVSKLLASKPDYILRKKSQEVLYSVTLGIDNLILNYVAATCVLVTETLFLVVIIAGVVALSPSAGLIALIVFGLSTLFISRLTSRSSKLLSEKSARLGVQYNERLLETLSVYRELLLRCDLDNASNETQAVRALTLRMRAQLIFLPTLSKYLFEFSLVIGGALVGLSQILFQDSNGAIASVVIFVAASTRILPSLIRAQNSFITMKQSEGFAQVTLDVVTEIDELLKIVEKSTYEEITSKFLPIINVENLTFSYPETDQNVLEEINFSIKAGQFVAIVGQSGAGKSTLVDLLLGMYEPTSGYIKVSGLPPRDAVNTWPGVISYVPQDIAIIDGTIAKNIALQDSDQQRNRIHTSLERAHLLDDVMAMNNKLSEVVGERGTRLSGGQRQRLGIARALYTNPQMIIFDEATSSLDPITEKSVTDAIYNKQSGVTLIVIAHRLSTVRHADLVILLDQGKLIAKGTFDEVRSLAPKFDKQAKLVNL
jgi:ABC-type multidrug transport system fused ATPase/permease subunit